jgi:hypothetical protein
MRIAVACLFLVSGCAADRIYPAKGGALPASAVDAASRIEVAKAKGYPEGFQCYEPLLFGLTLGLIPAHCVDSYTVSVVSGTGSEAQGTYKVSTWAGWASLLLAPIPGWHWHIGYGYNRDPVAEIKARVRDTSR